MIDPPSPASRPGAQPAPTWLVRGLALLLAAGGCGASCCSCVPSPSLVVRRGAALTPGPAPAPLEAPVSILHTGDFGLDTCQQDRVASALEEAHRRAPFALALFAGDNLYGCGPAASGLGAEACTFAADGATIATPPAGPPDPRFAEQHERALAGLASAPSPPRFLLVLGNHDVDVSPAHCGDEGLGAEVAVRRKACIEVAHQSPTWSMPGRHWVIEQGPVRLIGLDTNVVSADAGGFTLDDEVAFLEQATAACETRACFLVGHAPPASAGQHRDDGPADRAARVQRLLDAAGGRLRAWLGGHDHDLQHVRTPDGLDVLISGSGCQLNPGTSYLPSPGAELLFASTAPGLGRLDVAEAGWRYRFEDERGRALYCCAAEGAGPCQPVACR